MQPSALRDPWIGRPNTPRTGGGGKKRCRAMDACMLKKGPCSSPGIRLIPAKPCRGSQGGRLDGRVLGGRENPRRGGRWEMSGRATGTPGPPTLARSLRRGPFLAAGWDSAGRQARKAGGRAEKHQLRGADPGMGKRLRRSPACMHACVPWRGAPAFHHRPVCARSVAGLW